MSEKPRPCPFCGGEVAIALHGNEFGERWWTVQRGHDDATACKCRLFMESEKFCLDVEEGEQAKDSPWAMEQRARLVEKWNTRTPETCHREIESEAYICSECGGSLPGWIMNSYCHVCGRKVVDE